MSRSRKKTPIIKFGGCPGGKRAANRAVRRKALLGYKGNSYKKLYQQYYVNDFVWYCSKGQWQSGDEDADMERWEKFYKRK